jgi:hypothetical protein
LELDFEDCKVLVSNLDCQGSIHGGIVVQVLGEMSNRGGLAQKFVQTFFLAEQPKGYYVHNDIFRFLKDDHEEEQDEEVEEHEREQDEEDEDLTEMYAEKADEEDDDMIEYPALATGAEVVVIVPAVESKVAVAQESAAAAEANRPVATTPAKKPEPVEPRAKTETAPPVEVSQPIHPETAPAPAPVQAPPVQAPPAGPAKPKTWANLAAATSKAASPAVVTAPVKPQTSTPTPTSHNHVPNHGHGHGHGQGQHQNQGGYAQGQGQYRRPEYHSIFIKNVNDRITEEQLREAFTKFGRIKHLDTKQKKGCAFMDFATPESVVAALKQRHVQVGSEVVLAEERRRGNHGFNNNNNSNNFNNGPGGTANGRGGYYGNSNVNGHQQHPQSSFRGGRGDGSINGGVRGGGGPSDRKPTLNKPAQSVKS